VRPETLLYLRKAEDMDHRIEVIFIDVGNTLLLTHPDEAYQARARERITALVGATAPPAAFCALLDERYKAYRKWAFETLSEATECELWTKWLLPDHPYDQVAPRAGELTYAYRQTMGRREARPEARAVVEGLIARGYRLGILSNTITEREIPNWLEDDGLGQHFSPVVLSAVIGLRKPGADIYQYAAREAGVAPQCCAYVGDNPIRDVEGARKAGWGAVVLLLEPEDYDVARQAPYPPDAVIRNFSELLDLFPSRRGDG